MATTADEDEQLARALAASLADQDRQRLVARNDLEEQEALSLAVAQSLAAHDVEQQPGRGASLYPPIHPQQQPRYSPPQLYGGGQAFAQPPPVYPSAPPPQQQQQQQQPHYPSSSSSPHKQQQRQQGSGSTAAAGGRSSPGGAGASSSSNGRSGSGGGGGAREWWSAPLKLLDSAVQKVAAELGSGGIGGNSNACAGCGRALLGLGPTLSALGKQWHPACFKCAGCQQPMDAAGGGNLTFSVGQDGQPYHSQCHKQLFHPRCSVCGDFIPARGDGRIEWRENPFWKNSHCPSHSIDGTPQCCSCNKLKPVGEEWVGLQDGRLLCLDCLDTLVVDTKDAQPLYDEVLQFFSYMGMPHPYKAPLLLVEGPVLEEYADREGRPREPGASGPVFHIRGLCVAHVYTTIPSVVRAWGGQAGAVSSISTALAPLMQQQQPQQHCTVSVLLVMYGLPRLLIGSIVAHELMHAYLRMRNVAGLPLQVEEGLCQLMAMLWLDSQDHWARTHSNPYQQRLLSYYGNQIRTDTSDVYGEGFRIALELFQQRGLRALVEYVIKHHAWPQWTV